MDPSAVFYDTLSLMIQIALIGLIGFWGLYRGLIGETCLLTLSRLVMEVTFPCYIFIHITRNISIGNVMNLFWLPLACVLLLGGSYLIARLYLKIDKSIAERGEFSLLVTFQNAVYIPLPLIATLFPESEQNRIFLYLFVFNVPFTTLMFAVSPHVLRKDKGFSFSWRTLFSNPVIAVIVSLLVVGLGLHEYIPKPVASSMDMVGKITIPLVMIVIGGVILLNYRSKKPAHPLTIAKISMLKLLVIPFIVLGIIILFNIPKDFAVLFLLEACVPSASTLPLIARKEEADYRLIGATIFWSYIFSIITIPMFVSLYFYIYR
ncbi:MAG: AEC family transporter [Candidatus Auribacterota bacterium]|jgi:predicted permease|nr:AEC family transporter [Candidatus Auribacterota bacterium]